MVHMFDIRRPTLITIGFLVAFCIVSYQYTTSYTLRADVGTENDHCLKDMAVSMTQDELQGFIERPIDKFGALPPIAKQSLTKYNYNSFLCRRQVVYDHIIAAFGSSGSGYLINTMEFRETSQEVIYSWSEKYFVEGFYGDYSLLDSQLQKMIESVARAHNDNMCSISDENEMVVKSRFLTIAGIDFDNKKQLKGDYATESRKVINLIGAAAKFVNVTFNVDASPPFARSFALKSYLLSQVNPDEYQNTTARLNLRPPLILHELAYQEYKNLRVQVFFDVNGIYSLTAGVPSYYSGLASYTTKGLDYASGVLNAKSSISGESIMTSLIRIAAPIASLQSQNSTATVAESIVRKNTVLNTMIAVVQSVGSSMCPATKSLPSTSLLMSSSKGRLEVQEKLKMKKEGSLDQSIIEEGKSEVQNIIEEGKAEAPIEEEKQAIAKDEFQGGGVYLRLFLPSTYNVLGRNADVEKGLHELQRVAFHNVRQAGQEGVLQNEEARQKMQEAINQFRIDNAEFLQDRFAQEKLKAEEQTIFNDITQRGFLLQAQDKVGDFMRDGLSDVGTLIRHDLLTMTYGHEMTAAVDHEAEKTRWTRFMESFVNLFHLRGWRNNDEIRTATDEVYKAAKDAKSALAGLNTDILPMVYLTTFARVKQNSDTIEKLGEEEDVGNAMKIQMNRLALLDGLLLSRSEDLFDSSGLKTEIENQDAITGKDVSTDDVIATYATANAKLVMSANLQSDIYGLVVSTRRVIDDGVPASARGGNEYIVLKDVAVAARTAAVCDNHLRSQGMDERELAQVMGRVETSTTSEVERMQIEVNTRITDEKSKSEEEKEEEEEKEKDRNAEEIDPIY